MRKTDYGLKVAGALNAVTTLHSEFGQLLLECDSLFRGYSSCYGNTVTKQLTYGVRGPWINEAVFRFWDNGEEPKDGIRKIPGVTAIFRDSGKPELLKQPVFIAGIIDYRVPGKDILRVREWDLWHVWMSWSETPTFDTKMVMANPDDSIAEVRAVAVPLLSLESVEDVKGLFEMAGFTFPE